MTWSQSGKRATRDPWDIGFGVAVLVGALLSIFVWFPADIRTGFFHLNQIGKSEPGDAFFPIILATALVVLSIIQLLGALLRPQQRGADAAQHRLTGDNIKFLILFLAITAGGLAIMYWLGPLVTWAMRSLGLIDVDYRQLTDTGPYKYIGYVVGGFLMTIALIAWTEGRVRFVAILTVSLLLLLFIFIFDGLLHNILLPPNAEY